MAEGSEEGEDAYVTLLLTDSYLPGALVLAHSLRDAGTTKKLAVLVTLDSVSAEVITQLKAVYDYVFPVPRIRNAQPANLHLMNRPDLHSAFTKINLWRQTQFRKIVYIDADVLAYRAPDELFDTTEPFSAAPDIGWPDLFNTGVMVLKPNLGDYYALMAMAERGVSFDGADQGLLNMYFKNSYNRLPFTYNVTPSAHYQYVPAYRHFQSSINMVHFIGPEKPWVQGRNAHTGEGPFDEIVGRWWAVYDRHYRPQSPDTSTTQEKIPELVQYFVKGEYQPTIAYVVPTGEPQSPPGQRQPPPSQPSGTHGQQYYTSPPHVYHEHHHHEEHHYQPPPPHVHHQEHHHEEHHYYNAPPHDDGHHGGDHHHHHQPPVPHSEPPRFDGGPPVPPANPSFPSGFDSSPSFSTSREPEAEARPDQVHTATVHEPEQEKPKPPPMQPSWDAQWHPPPSESRPEALNFPQTHYEMSSSVAPFVPPERYPSPPRNMWYEVPKEPPAPARQKPRPIFPWEEHRPQASRVFVGAPEDDKSTATPSGQSATHHPPPIAFAPPPQAPPQAFQAPPQAFAFREGPRAAATTGGGGAPATAAAAAAFVQEQRQQPHYQHHQYQHHYQQHQPQYQQQHEEHHHQQRQHEEHHHRDHQARGAPAEHASVVTVSSASEQKSEPVTPTTPTIPTTAGGTTAPLPVGPPVPLPDPWATFTLTNAWDDVPEIERYVDTLQQKHHRRGKASLGSGSGLRLGGGFGTGAAGAGAGATGEVMVGGRRRGSRLTDFPSEVERPSLPVTPAPIRRPMFWSGGFGGGGSHHHLGGAFFGDDVDDDDDDEDDGSGGPRLRHHHQLLPFARGVPAQSDWVCVHGNLWSPADCLCDLTNVLRYHKDPVAQLQKLAQQQSELLMQKFGMGGSDGGGGGEEEEVGGEGEGGEGTGVATAAEGEASASATGGASGGGGGGGEGSSDPAAAPATTTASTATTVVLSPKPVKPTQAMSPPAARVLFGVGVGVGGGGEDEPRLSAPEAASAASAMMTMATTTATTSGSSIIPEPSYHGPGVAWEKGEDVPLRETPMPPTEEDRDVLET